MSEINDIIDLIETQLLTNSNWGPSAEDIYWMNNKNGQTQFSEDDCPKTLVFVEQAPIIQESTISDETEWLFQIKNYSWAGGVLYQKANLKAGTDLHNEFVVIYNNILAGSDCAWLNNSLVFDYENIEDRLIITERFSLTVTENR